jgi:hypothetical protein
VHWMMRRLKNDEYLQMEKSDLVGLSFISHRGRRGHRGVLLIDMRRTMRVVAICISQFSRRGRRGHRGVLLIDMRRTMRVVAICISQFSRRGRRGYRGVLLIDMRRTMRVVAICISQFSRSGRRGYRGVLLIDMRRTMRVVAICISQFSRSGTQRAQRAFYTQSNARDTVGCVSGFHFGVTFAACLKPTACRKLRHRIVLRGLTCSPRP